MDYEYMAGVLSSLSGIPVRLYRDGKFVELYHTNKFKPDLAIWEEPNIFASEASVSYYLSPDFLFYGLFRVKEENVCLVLGPVLQTPISKRNAEKLLRSMGESPSRAQELMDYVNFIPRYPLRNFLQILCAFAFFINGEKLSISDIMLGDVPMPQPEPLSKDEGQREEPRSDHNTYSLEQEMLSLITYGRVEELKKLFQAPVSGRAGTLAESQIRQQKNLFIVSATLESRAAIRGGINPSDAFKLSDLYIQKVELLESYESISQLGVQMALDYASRVAALSGGENNAKLLRSARQYILEHITEKIPTSELAEALGYSRSYLSTYFKQETGSGLNEYIMKLKIEEATRLLSATNRPLIEISEHLGFSSQSYFQNVFKKVMGMTPQEYREKV